MDVALLKHDQHRKYHAHFDCFSGAAGDMMLASCLDASGDPKALLDRIVDAIRQGIPPLEHEFRVSSKKVWRGVGSISALHVNVESLYDHKPAPVPAKASASHDNGDGHSHEHAHHAVNSGSGQEHNHSPIQHSTAHTHSHSHDLCQKDSETPMQDDSDREHSHQHEHHDHSHQSLHDHSHGHDSDNGPLRNLPEIRKMLQDAPEEFIPKGVRETAIEAFTELAKAEASVHGAAGIDAVHFHEVGAVDSIVDTIGTLLALHFLGVGTVSCSPLPLGEGTVWTDHGVLPVPAPATLRLMVGMRTAPGPPGITGELVTPTAAALLRVLTKAATGNHTGRPPSFTVRSVGIGAGTKDFEKHPNILRLILGDHIVLRNNTP